jgi:transglycosylase-like protein with SLT domain/Sel1 repeat-containing protein
MRRLLSVFALTCCGLSSSVYAAAGEWKSAAFAETLRNQARAYEHGEGVDKNQELAASLYCDASRHGDAEAQYSLGWMYANGRGVPRDDNMASYFFGLAAEQGHEYAKKMLRFVGDYVDPEVPQCMRKTFTKPEQRQQSVRYKPSSELAEFVPITPDEKLVFALVNRYAPEYGIDPKLVLAVIKQESNFNPAARSSKNAQGLMQLIPETAARFNVKRPFDPEQNMRGGLAYLRWLLAYFQGNVPLVVAAYNAGEGAVNRFRGIPPYPETHAYVRRIMELFGRSEHPYDAAVTGQSPALARIK